MNYKILKDKIEIYNADDFNPKHIAECGQMFRFYVVDGKYVIISDKNIAIISSADYGYIIDTNNSEYFVNYFDLNYDYAEAKKRLSKNKVLLPSINSGHGIRIINGNKIEIILEFIISANNNIKRIQKIVEKLCEIGDKKSFKNIEYHAFPSLEKLSLMDEKWYNSLGAGYRAEYLKETVAALMKVDMSKIEKLSNEELYKWLISLKGVGPKVASCIMLFGFGRKSYFPVDTWVEKVYYNHFSRDKRSRKQIQEYFEKLFEEDSGLAQQFLFNHERNN